MDADGRPYPVADRGWENDEVFVVPFDYGGDIPPRDEPVRLVDKRSGGLIFRSAWALALALVVHGIGWVACLREPRIFDLWLVRASRCPRVRNYRFWRCNSYRA